jgi:hypothetical protein
MELKQVSDNCYAVLNEKNRVCDANSGLINRAGGEDHRKEVPREKVKLPKRSMKHAYDDQATLKGRKFVPEKY